MIFNLIKGLLVGLTVSAPLGPIGLLCLHYSVSQGFRLAIVAGLGAAVADTLFAAIAGFGLQAISEWLHTHYTLLAFIGGLFLSFLGLKIWMADPLLEDKKEISCSGWSAFFSTFFFTLSNPITLLTFAVFFSCIPEGLGICSWDHISLILLGIFLGAMLWWVLLALSGTYLRANANLVLLNQVRSGFSFLIMIFGILSVAYSLLYLDLG